MVLAKHKRRMGSIGLAMWVALGVSVAACGPEALQSQSEAMPLWDGDLAKADEAIWDYWHEKLMEHAIQLGTIQTFPHHYRDANDTSKSSSDLINSYPGYSQNESGNEIVYAFTLDQEAIVTASVIIPKSSKADIDVHLLSRLSPPTVIQRDDQKVVALVGTGENYLVLDSFEGRNGSYQLTVDFEAYRFNHLSSLGGYEVSLQLPFYRDIDNGDTSRSDSDYFDKYPPYSQDESGPEDVYAFSIQEPAVVSAWLETPERSGVDNDLHLLSSLAPVDVIARDDNKVSAELAPGVYYLSVDSYADYAGPYQLHFSAEKVDLPPMNFLKDETGQDITGALPLPFEWQDSQDTAASTSDKIDRYPPNSQDESGPEIVYEFTVDRDVIFLAEIPSTADTGVDNDLHLLSSLVPMDVLARDDRRIEVILSTGTYYLSVDSFMGHAGPYELSISVKEYKSFGKYLKMAVDDLAKNHSHQGYDISCSLTQNIPYGPTGADIIDRTCGSKSMCVAGVMEVILVAMRYYYNETGDANVYRLPASSWEGGGRSDIKSHLYLYSYGGVPITTGTGEALENFGMGQQVPFTELTPYGFLNYVRYINGRLYGHAVVFISFIDSNLNEYTTWNKSVVGFKYFGNNQPTNGFEYRYGVFSGKSLSQYLPAAKKDLGIRYSDMCVGVMHHPNSWTQSIMYSPFGADQAGQVEQGVFDPTQFGDYSTEDLDKLDSGATRN